MSMESPQGKRDSKELERKKKEEEEEVERKGVMSRRGFLKGAVGAISGAAVLATMGAESAEATEDMKVFDTQFHKAIDEFDGPEELKKIMHEQYEKKSPAARRLYRMVASACPPESFLITVNGKSSVSETEEGEVTETNINIGISGKCKY